MATTGDYRPPTVTRGGLGTQGSMASIKTQSPGGANGRIDYGLHEHVMRTVVLDKVKEARQATIESKPDILGLRGQTWSSTVAYDNAK